MKNLLLFNIITCVSLVGAMQPPVSEITLISQDLKEFAVPREAALKAQTIANLLSMPHEDQDKVPLPIDSTAVKTIAAIMRSSHAKPHLKGKQLLDALESSVPDHEQQFIDLTRACDFLTFDLGIRLIAQHAIKSKTKTNLYDLMSMVKNREIAANTANIIEGMYYLLSNGNDYSPLHNHRYTFSIKDYLDYLPAIIRSARRNNATLFLSSLRLDSMKGFTELEDLNNLQTLSLRENQLTQLPDNFTNLTNLQTLYLNGNQFCQLPASVANLTNLQKLCIDYTLVTSASTLAKLTHLQTLNIANGYREENTDKQNTYRENITQIKKMLPNTLVQEIATY